jgi:hypothetical protein
MIFEKSVNNNDAMIQFTLRVPNVTAIYSIFRNMCYTVLADWKSACATIHAVEGSKTRHIENHREISELRIVSSIRTGTLIKVVLVLSKVVHGQDCEPLRRTKAPRLFSIYKQQLSTTDAPPQSSISLSLSLSL